MIQMEAYMDWKTSFTWSKRTEKQLDDVFRFKSLVFVNYMHGGTIETCLNPGRVEPGWCFHKRTHGIQIINYADDIRQARTIPSLLGFSCKQTVDIGMFIWPHSLATGCALKEKRKGHYLEDKEGTTVGKVHVIMNDDLAMEFNGTHNYLCHFVNW